MKKSTATNPKPEFDGTFSLSFISRMDFRIGERLRPLNEEEVRKAEESILAHGLLSPIGVREPRKGGEEGY
jgi:ParB-like chromosome segregation protein Spo0J